MLGCGRTQPKHAKRGSNCPNPEDRFELDLRKAENGHCESTPPPNGCNRTSGLCVPKKEGEGGCFFHSTLPPITSALINTKRAFKFGRLEIRAKLPRGDWLWPAIWLLPKDYKFGGWPRSGEIDIMESRGNEANGCGPYQGVNGFGSTLHFGPDYMHNGFKHTHTERQTGSGRTYDQDFHIYGLEWGAEGLYTYVDNRSNVVLSVPFTETFWERGQRWSTTCDMRFPSGKCEITYPQAPSWHNDTAPNLWAGGTNATPFDQEFFLQINLAIGGTGKFFPNVLCRHKPWDNTKPSAMEDFLSAYKDWWPTWGGDVNQPEKGASKQAAMVIDWVRYWAPGGAAAA